LTDYKSPPLQPVYETEYGPRFQENKVVHLLYHIVQDTYGGVSRQLAAKQREKGWEIPDADWDQFNQLIGYSMHGLPWIDGDLKDAAILRHEQGLTEEQARLQSLETLVDGLRHQLRSPMATLYGVHPDDLMEIQETGSSDEK